MLPLFQTEPAPVTSTVLLREGEEEALPPMMPMLLNTLPLLVIVRLLPEPLAPTARLLLLLQTEPAPVTSTALLLEEALLPMKPAVLNTVPPLAIVRLLLEPWEPTRRKLLLLQTEPAPVTTTALLLAPTALPI